MLTAASHKLYVATWDIHKGLDTFQGLRTSTASRSNETTMTSITRELPMPNVSKISSLSQAEATLLHCQTKVSKFAVQSSPVSSGQSSQTSSPITEDRQDFQKWLEQWEHAFTAFLTNAMATMSDDDVTQSRVLKANHLACTILAADEPSIVNAFEAEYQAIVELAGAVLRFRSLADSPQDLKPRQPSPISAGLGVRDPLYVVTSRCNHETTRNKAVELLSRYCSDGRM